MKPRRVFVVFDADGIPAFAGVGTNSHDAWETCVLWASGTIYGQKDYRKKKRALIKRGYRCHRMRRERKS